LLGAKTPEKTEPPSLLRMLTTKVLSGVSLLWLLIAGLLVVSTLNRSAARPDHFAFMPPPLDGFGFFGVACFLPLPALPIAMPLPALSLYTGSPVTA